jgi:hypothetical protein
MYPVYVDYIYENKYGSLGLAALNRGSLAFLKHSDRLRVLGYKSNLLVQLPKAIRLDKVLRAL